LKGQPEESDRHRAERDGPAEARVELAAAGGISQAGEPGAPDPEEIVSEEQQHGRHRSELRDGGERRAGVLPAGEGRDDPQVGCAGDREELGQPLGQAEHDRLEHAHDPAPLGASCRSIASSSFGRDESAAAVSTINRASPRASLSVPIWLSKIGRSVNRQRTGAAATPAALASARVATAAGVDIAADTARRSCDPSGWRNGEQTAW
jgi:hypothetical protein